MKTLNNRPALPFIDLLDTASKTHQFKSILALISDQNYSLLIRYIYLVTIQRAMASCTLDRQQELVKALLKSDDDFCDWVNQNPDLESAMIEASQRAILALNDNQNDTN